MGTDRTHWTKKIDDLLCEVITSKETYNELSRTEDIPQKQQFFKQQAQQRQRFEKILSDEILALNDGGVVKRRKEGICVFDAVAAKVNSGDLTAIEVDRLILQKEQALLTKYQEILAFKDLPDVTAALLQSQAEDMNDIIQKLKLELNLEENDF